MSFLNLKEVLGRAPVAEKPKKVSKRRSLSAELALILVLSSCSPIDAKSAQSTQDAASVAGAIATLKSLGTEIPAPKPTKTPKPSPTITPSPTATPFSGVVLMDERGTEVRYPTEVAPSCKDLLGCPGKTRFEMVDGVPVAGSAGSTDKSWPWVLGGITAAGLFGIAAGTAFGVRGFQEKQRFSVRRKRR